MRPISTSAAEQQSRPGAAPSRPGPDRPWAPLRPRVVETAAVGAVVATVAMCIGALVTETVAGRFVGPFQASAYWVTYVDGFVRRGLPGEALRLLTRGAPTMREVELVAVVMMLLAAAAVVLVVRTLRAHAASPSARLVVTALVVASPFTFSLLVRDAGRYDTLGYCVAGLVVWSAVRPPATTAQRVAYVAALSGALAAATAAEELLIAFLAPLAVLSLIRLGLRGGALLAAGAVVLLPAGVLAAASAVVRPSVASLFAATYAARAAGVTVSPSVPNAISALVQTPQQGLVHQLTTSPLTVAVSLTMFGGCYVATLVLLWLALGRPVPGPFWSAAVGFGAVALSLSALGTDYRRWWALAFVTATAAVALHARSPAQSGAWAPVRQQRALWIVGVPVVLLLSVLGQVIPVYQWWDPAAATDFVLEAPATAGQPPPGHTAG